MTKRLPQDVDKEIRDKAYEICEQNDYGNNDRMDSSSFIDMLLARSDIGGRLSEYMPNSQVRVYIKDSICGKYTKDLAMRKKSEYPPEKAIMQVYGVNASLIAKAREVSVYRDEEDNYYLVDYCTLVRWESALRRILEYIACTRDIYDIKDTLRICLVIDDQTNKLTSADKEQLYKTLGIVNTKALII